jgi:hypothetical protein
MVAALVKEKGCTFPDPKGAWRWSQLGLDATGTQWADTVGAKLQAIR